MALQIMFFFVILLSSEWKLFPVFLFIFPCHAQIVLQVRIYVNQQIKFG